MESYGVVDIRNVVIVAHGGAGKTSLVESFLYSLGITSRLGRVDDGNTVSDFDPEEIQRKVSISSSLIYIDYKGKRINTIDTPGYADFASDTNDIKSTSGYVFLFGGTSVSWSSKKQNCVAKSTMKAEYISCSTTASNAVWIGRFVESLNIGIPNRPVNVFCDNKSAISLIKSGAHSSKGKHIDINYHYIQDIVEKGEIKVEFISSTEMVADPMTKGLPLDKFKEFISSLLMNLFHQQRWSRSSLHGLMHETEGSGDAWKNDSMLFCLNIR